MYSSHLHGNLTGALAVAGDHNNGETFSMKRLFGSMIALNLMLLPLPALAADCAQLAADGLTPQAMKNALQKVLAVRASTSSTPNGGLGFPMWLTLVDGSGVVCAVVNSLAPGQDVTSDIWLGSRVISAQKANTANDFSTGKLALSTANLYAATQPGGSLYGLQASNPVDVSIAYVGSASSYGTGSDPLVGKKIGGVNVFGGGLALYSNGHKIGAIGVSGDTSCTDHVVAWKVRAQSPYANVPMNASGFDAMLQDITPNPYGGTGISASGFGHPTCLNNPTPAQSGAAIIGN
jgi:Haem-degrading